jgi:hypothetical protein
MEYALGSVSVAKGGGRKECNQQSKEKRFKPKERKVYRIRVLAPKSN